MSRVASKPVDLPQGVSATVGADSVTVKGAKGSLTLVLKSGIKVEVKDKRLEVAAQSAAEGLDAVAGATRAHLQNMVAGVTKGYEKKLELVGVGYRAAVSAKSLTLTLGYSHLINYAIPEGITIETPSQTEIVVKGIDRQRVGQTAAEIRGFRPPEPYKGKGVKYVDEKISLKEAKKK
ncbi:MAG TPA: 50S ribosomal protein L6 [Steroidobacteraceae bacterium]|nr:50S ribosomal protein L6 [Steroidobacteraceae bacterium]